MTYDVKCPHCGKIIYDSYLHIYEPNRDGWGAVLAFLLVFAIVVASVVALVLQ
jgi:hypothetical protein